MNTHYTATAKALHWTIALLIFAVLSLGFYMTDLSLTPSKLMLYSWHKWAGVAIFLLALVRLVWRATHQPPALPEHMAPIEQLVARFGHTLLYMLMLAIPLSGWLMSSAKGFQTVWFGFLPIPDLVRKDQEIGDLMQTVHVSLNFLLIAVLLGHTGAALKHHFFDKDQVLVRMLPRLPGAQTNPAD